MMKKLGSFIKAIIFVSLVFLSPYSAYCFDTPEYSVGQRNVILDLPNKFALVEDTGSRLSFAFGESGVYFQIKFQTEPFSSVASLGESTIKKMGGTGEGTWFSYKENPAWFGSFTFGHGGTEYSSYILTIQQDSSAFVMVSFCPTDLVNQYNDILVSAIDSFAFAGTDNSYYGPLGAFDRYFADTSTTPYSTQIEGSVITANLQKGFTESEDFAIQREARILNADGTVTGWKRFYRMIFKDMYPDLLPLAQAFERSPLFSADDISLAVSLLSYVQGFSYSRAGTLSDLHPGLTSVFDSTGDCDTRSLVYLSLLHYFDIKGILLVSTVYMHGLAAIDVEKTGAGYVLDGKKYIIAETTEKVDLGLIASDMADPANWIPVELWER